jgi:phosphoglycolate phosphatase-like HAD superfamily hydrolase
MIQKIMKMTGIKHPKYVAKVGDSLLDLQEGTNADCGYVIGICSGAYTKEELATQAHTHLISDLSELAGIFFPQSQESA